MKGFYKNYLLSKREFYVLYLLLLFGEKKGKNVPGRNDKNNGGISKIKVKSKKIKVK